MNYYITYHWVGYDGTLGFGAQNYTGKKISSFVDILVIANSIKENKKYQEIVILDWKKYDNE